MLKERYDHYITDKVLLAAWINFYIRIDDKVRKARVEISLYLAGFWLMGLAFFGASLGLGKVFVNVISWTTMIVTATAFLIELYRWSDRIQEFVEKKLIGKALLAGFTGAAGAFSLAYASTLINSFTKVASNPLPYTTAFTAIPAALALIALVLVAISAIIGAQTLLSAAIMTFFNLVEIVGLALQLKFARREVFERRTFINFMRLFGCVVLVVAVVKSSESYESGLTEIAKNFAYTFELQKFDRCAREGEKVVRINDEEVLVARDPSRFEPRICPIAKAS